MKQITLSGGCFWCIEADMKKIPHLISIKSGFTPSENAPKIPSTVLEMTKLKQKGLYRESVQIIYNDNITYLSTILEHFLQIIDPIDPYGSFCDRGFQYTSSIFVQNNEEYAIAYKTLEHYKNLYFPNHDLAVLILPFIGFFPLAENHQNFSEKYPEQYLNYKNNSGRKEFFKKKFL